MSFNRMNESLPVLEILIVYSGGVMKRDPNSLIMSAIGGEISALPGFPDLRSIISGTCGAVIYMSADVQLVITSDECDRLCRHDLTQREYRSLKEKYGIFFEIHKDFYDPTFADALQAVQRRK